jgi:hypothetical protein
MTDTVPLPRLATKTERPPSPTITATGRLRARSRWRLPRASAARSGVPASVPAARPTGAAVDPARRRRVRVDLQTLIGSRALRMWPILSEGCVIVVTPEEVTT